MVPVVAFEFGGSAAAFMCTVVVVTVAFLIMHGTFFCCILFENRVLSMHMPQQAYAIM